MDGISAARDRTLAPAERAAAKLASANKLYVRERIDLLFDDCTFVEDGQLANAMAADLPADGVVTGRAWSTDGQPSWWLMIRVSRPAPGAPGRWRRSSG